ncbi:DUF6636 domain-containing protein [Jidongwangia harbinensis]|uniref:DUF6636 domain-containing protein n=1 Tax=Jidongwangia harbinensis TaxID=2878561 RepID=UPI001CD9C575|nr:DUF6636 domain-containing protein [Jidongwangia harbinensis]MCA2215169.1 hypothetical protein [Jidongwangia harbinensis]
MRTVWRALGLLTAALVLTACDNPGDDADPGPTAGGAAQPAATVGLGDRGSGPSSAGTTTREITATFQFTTPSKNIGCLVAADTARCDIVQKAWKAPPKPADCTLDYGKGLSVGPDQKAAEVCAGDTVLGSKEILPYGQAVRVGEFVCESESSGVRCRNLKSEHGFTISRDAYTVF